MKRFKEFLNEEEQSKTIDLREFLSDEQIKWCRNHVRDSEKSSSLLVNSWSVNRQGEIEVDHDLYFTNKRDIEEFLVQFADVMNGNFSCQSCTNLISLKGSPRKVSGYLDLDLCAKLSSLEGAPVEVGSDIYINCISLVSLEGLPKKFKSLRGSCPKLPRVEQDFIEDVKLQEEWKKSPLDWQKFMYGSAAKGRKFGL